MTYRRGDNTSARARRDDADDGNKGELCSAPPTSRSRSLGPRIRDVDTSAVISTRARPVSHDPASPRDSPRILRVSFYVRSFVQALSESTESLSLLLALLPALKMEYRGA